MAKQVIGVGTKANDQTGDPIRDAFVKVNANFTELYDDDAGDVGSITATAPIARDSATGAVTISLNDAGVTFAKMQNVAANSLLIRNANSSGVLSELALATTQIMIGDGTGMVAAALSADVTMDNAGAVTIGNDKITFAKLGVEYTASSPLSSGTAVPVNTALGDVFTMTTGHAATLNFTNVGIGDMKTLMITSGGAYSVALGTVNTASCTFNLISGTYSQTGSAKNLIQIKWVATNEAWYTISQIAS
jgi:hypothetical protein